MKRKRKSDSGFWFDRAAADRAVSFFPDIIRHVKGEWLGSPITL